MDGTQTAGGEVRAGSIASWSDPVAAVEWQTGGGNGIEGTRCVTVVKGQRETERYDKGDGTVTGWAVGHSILPFAVAAAAAAAEPGPLHTLTLRRSPWGNLLEGATWGRRISDAMQASGRTGRAVASRRCVELVAAAGCWGAQAWEKNNRGVVTNFTCPPRNSQQAGRRGGPGHPCRPVW
jgi:hypothetical protein